MSSFKISLDPAGMARFHAEVSRARGRIVEDIASDARSMAPVDTGEMVSTINADRSRGEVTVGSDHWQFVEFGTRYQRAQPFMRPAFYKQRAVR